MKRDKPGTVVVFRSAEPETVRRAADRLQAAGIPFGVVNRNEGSSKRPRTVQRVLVPPESSGPARSRLADLPSELEWGPDQEPVSAESRAIARIQFALLIVVLVTALVMGIMNR